MVDKPRRTKTARPVRTRRGIRQKPGVAEKPESASRRLRSRSSATRSVATVPASSPEGPAVAEPTARPKPRAVPAPRVRRAAEQHGAVAPAAEEAAAAAGPALEIAAALSDELSDFARRLLEDSTTRARELTAARTLPELVKIQARQLTAVSDAWLQHTARMREIFLARFGEKSRRQKPQRK